MKQNRYCTYCIVFAVLFLILYTGSVFIVSGMHMDLFGTYRKYWTIFGVILCLLVTALLTHDDQLIAIRAFDILFKGICLTGIAKSLFALAQYFMLIPSYNYFFVYTGSFDNPAIFAMQLSFCIPIAVYYAVTHVGRISIRWWIVACGLFVFVAFSESRTGIIASVFAVLVVTIVESNRMHKLLMSNLHTVFVILPILILILYFLYRFKADSANGRLLIWRVAMDMIVDRPLLGFGTDGFLSSYMEYQAEFLDLHPESPFILQADNINHPFNEFLMITIRYGIVGLVSLIFAFVQVTIGVVKNCEKGKGLLLSQVAVLFIWCFFSYPFRIPFVWVTVSIVIIMIIEKSVSPNFLRIGRITMLPVFVYLMCLTATTCKWKIKWLRVQEQSLAGQTNQMFTEYAVLYGKLSDNGSFLYNYAAELYYSGYYNESLVIAKECFDYWNDYDVQLLLAEDCLHTCDTLSAISHYEQASRMIPARFYPLYSLMQIYQASDDTLTALGIAETIIHKDVKIDRSKDVQRMIDEARELYAKYNK